jgi:23S rRNA (uracil1939-C5)-methyltransferase
MPERSAGGELTLRIEKAVAGGEMLARHEGQIVLVAGAIPGELVRARVDRVVARTVRASVTAVLEPSGLRRPVLGDPACGGQHFAHIAYTGQTLLKAAIVQDAWERIARLAWPGAPAVVASPEHGYRMRARLHGQDGRIGFLREGSHHVCGADAGGQLLPGTVAWAREVEQQAVREGLAVSAIELTEDVAGTARAVHVEMRQGAPSPAFLAVVGGTGSVSWAMATPGPVRGGRRPRGAGSTPGSVIGDASLADGVAPGPGQTPVSLRRHATAFFQGNRYLLAPLVQHVVAAARGPVLDLYAGVGLFGLCAVAAGLGPVTLVEGDAVSGADLRENATPFGAGVQTVQAPVERYVQSPDASRFEPATVIVDPPRTGMLPDTARAVARLAKQRIIFVSCDPATFARDAKLLDEGGFILSSLTVFDLFPNTAHVESVGVFDRR